MKQHLMNFLFCSVFGFSSLTAQPFSSFFTNRATGLERGGQDSTGLFSQPEFLYIDKSAERPFVFWIGVGFGYGSAERVCEDCGESRHPNGSSFQGKLGVAINKRILIGLEIDIWVNGWEGWNSKSGTEGRKIHRNHFMLVSYWYPLKQTRLFTKFGTGLSFYSAYDRYLPYGDSVTSLVDGGGLGLAAGAGYDVRIARQLFISPSITYFHGNLGDLILNSRIKVATNKKLNLIDFNVAFIFHAPK